MEILQEKNYREIFQKGLMGNMYKTSKRTSVYRIAFQLLTAQIRLWVKLNYEKKVMRKNEHL